MTIVPWDVGDVTVHIGHFHLANTKHSDTQAAKSIHSDSSIVSVLKTYALPPVFVSPL